MAVLNNNALVGAAGKGGAAALPQRSLRFNSADSSFLSRTFSTAGNRRTWTFSCWAKRTSLGTEQYLFAGIGGSPNPHMSLAWQADGSLAISPYDGGYPIAKTTAAKFRDVGAWYHFVFTIDTNNAVPEDRNRIYVNGTRITDWSGTNINASPGYEGAVNNSVLHHIGRWAPGYGYFFDGMLADIYFIDSQALTPSAFAYTDNATGRWEPKAYAGSYSGNSFYLDFSDNSAATATTLGADRSGLGNNWVPNNFSVSADYYYSAYGWAGVDSSIPAGYTRTSNPFDCLVNNNTGVIVNWGTGSDGYFAIKPTSSTVTIRWIVYDGSGNSNPTVTLHTTGAPSFPNAISPSSLTGNGSTGSNSVGTYTGLTVGTTYYLRCGRVGEGNPALVTYITNATIASLGQNPAALPGIDSLRDHPVSAGVDTGLGGEVSGNYCTLNPLTSGFGGGLTNGNLDWSIGANLYRAEGTIAVTSGKWWWEATAVSGSTNGTVGGRFGLCVSTTKTDPEAIEFNLYWHATAGLFTYINGQNTQRLSGTNYGDGDILGCALDADANIAYLYKNGTLVYTYNFSSHVPVGSAFLTPHGWNASSGTPVWSYNFGARLFSYPAPAGYKCLCDKNLAAPLIARPSTVMDVLAWTGSGAGTDKTISGLNFTDGPDLIWAKTRSSPYHNTLFDVVRGYGQRNALISDQAYIEGYPNSGRIKSVSSTSITWENDGGALWYDGSGQSYVAWTWDAGSTAMPKVYGAAASVSNTAALATTLISTASPSTVGSSYQNYDIDLQVSVTSAQIKFTYTANPIETLVSADGTTWISKGSTSQSAGATATVTHGSAFRYIRYYYSGGNWNQGFQFINNTSGTINSTVLVNASAGFSITSYSGNGSSGALVGHGLGVTPQMVILKQRTGTDESWRVYHVGVNDLSKTLYLNQSTAAVSNTERISGVSSTTFTLSTGFAGVNASGVNYVAYCFAPVAGYSAVGKWSGGTDAFVHLGFRPKWLLIKANAASHDWMIFDTSRSPFNVADDWLSPNLANAEQQNNAVNYMDILSNGFKIKGTGGYFGTAADMLYVAFAESPFQYARAR